MGQEGNGQHPALGSQRKRLSLPFSLLKASRPVSIGSSGSRKGRRNGGEGVGECGEEGLGGRQGG